MTTLVAKSMQVSYDALCRYGELTCDPNPIHTDRAFAARTEMGGIIAQGTLSLSIVWDSLAETFGTHALEGIVLDIRFTRPVRENDVITVQGAPVGDDPLSLNLQVVNQHGDTVVKGLVHLKPPPGQGR